MLTLDLPIPIMLHWSSDPFLALDDGRPWLFGPIERDPMARDGRGVVPRVQLRRLTSLAERGPPFQRLAIAHELDPDGPVAGGRTAAATADVLFDPIVFSVLGRTPPAHGEACLGSRSLRGGGSRC